MVTLLLSLDSVQKYSATADSYADASRTVTEALKSDGANHHIVGGLWELKVLYRSVEMYKDTGTSPFDVLIKADIQFSN